MLAQTVHTADPNIIVPAIVAAIPTTIAAAAGLFVALRAGKRNREATEAVHAEVRTNHGLRAGEYLEMIGPLVDWAIVHTDQDNELREALGLRPALGPQLARDLEEK